MTFGTQWGTILPPQKTILRPKTRQKNELAQRTKRVTSLACARSRLVIAFVHVTVRQARRAVALRRFVRGVAQRAFLMLGQYVQRSQLFNGMAGQTRRRSGWSIGAIRRVRTMRTMARGAIFLLVGSVRLFLMAIRTLLFRYATLGMIVVALKAIQVSFVGGQMFLRMT
jgi:hypothetical protein